MSKDGFTSICKECIAAKSIRGKNKVLQLERIKRGFKMCSLCQTEKPLSEFHFKKRGIGGYSAECKDCVSKRGKIRYKAVPIPSERLNVLKTHAKRLKVPFDITRKDIELLWVKQGGLCYYSQLPMAFDGKRLPNAISIDRIDRSKGYVNGNVVLCCDAINTMKGRSSYEEMLIVCKAMVEHPLDLDHIPGLRRIVK